MMNKKKNKIGLSVLLIAILFSFVSLNVNTLYATAISGYDAEQELIRQKKEIASKKNSQKEKKSTRKETLVIDNTDEELESGSNSEPHGVQLYGAQHHNELDGKKNVITHDGGGMGVGGGAKKSSGGKAGKSISISDSGASNQEVIKNSDATKTDGKDLISETMGFAKDDGEFYKENEGSHAGAKIFELDRNGGFGFDEDHIGVSNIKGFMSFFLFAAFGLGGLSFFMATRDVRSKNNYF